MSLNLHTTKALAHEYRDDKTGYLPLTAEVQGVKPIAS